MKPRKLHNAKNSALTFLLLFTMFVATLGLISPRVYAQPTIAIIPATNVANPGESFLINVTITGVTDLWTYGGKLGFDVAVLQAVNVTEGPFLKKDGWSTSFAKSIDNFAGIIVFSNTRKPGFGPNIGADGDGTLFTVGFNVEAAGTSTLDLYDTLLLDPDGVQLDHGVSDGTFYTEVPVASYDFSPKTYGRPIVGENVTFDASASYDPLGGGILNYTWDFGDGTNSTGMIVTHIYNASSSYLDPYNVTLAIIDDDNETNTVFSGVDVKFHDISIVEIATPEEIFLHEVAIINVTVLNNGTHPDKFNVTAHYNSNSIKTETVLEVPPGENTTIIFDWYTFIVPQNSSSNSTSGGDWIYPLNASASDDVYTYSSSNQSSQEYLNYDIDTTGWKGISKVEVGIEVKTDTGGDDQVSIQVWLPGKSPGKEHKIPNITWTNDTTFWVDVTSDYSSWSTGTISNIRVRIKYIQFGGTATPIYVDWLPVRITPLNPIDAPLGTYAIWANALLVDPVSLEFRVGEEEDTTDNTLFGSPIVITQIPDRDIAVTNVTVSPTEVVYGRTATVKVEIENQGNTEETFRVELYANSTAVGNQTGVNLLAGATQTLRFTWYEATNTTDEGTYNITVYIPPVVNENDTTNNDQTLFVQMRLLPRPLFTFSPEKPIMGEEVTFDASASYAPGGTITDYLWDFGDGTNATGIITTHTYNNPSTYSTKLTVIDNENLNHTESQAVQVQKLASNITISASPVPVPLSINTTISGSITPIRANVTVSVNYTRIEEIDWITLGNVSTNENGQYSFVWTPQRHGDYQFKTFWQGDAITLPAESSVLNVTVIIQDIAVADVALSKIKLTTGESLTIDVTITNKGTATETFNVAVYYNDTLLETKTLTNLTEGSTETLGFNWDTQGIEESVYIIKAVAEPLLGETYVTDNTQTKGVVIEELPVNIFLYTTIGLAIVTAIIAVYLVRILRSKPK